MQHKTTYTILPLMALFLFANALNAQSTRELFARPGLAIGAYHFNFYDGIWNTSWRYAGDTIFWCDTMLVFERLSNTQSKRLLKIEGGKVFVQSWNLPCSNGTLYYDFDLQVGDSIRLQAGGPILTVAKKDQINLLNGESRRYLKLGGNGWTVEWIEGIGDVDNGMFPAFYDFEGYDTFVCARDATGDLWQNPAENWQCDSSTCPVPIPSFTATENERTATFSNTTLNGNTWLWEFGDGQTSTEMNPVHTYSKPGCYEVCLNAYASCLQKPIQKCLPTPICVDPAWVKIPQPSVDLNTQSISDIEFVDANTGWMLASRSIWKTTDGGKNWTRQTVPNVQTPDNRILKTIQMVDAQTGIISCGGYYGGTEKSILITHDGGQTWEERAPDDNSFSMEEAILTSDGQGFATGELKDLLYSNDGGDTWSTRKILKQAEVELFWFQYMGNNTLYAFGYKGSPHNNTPAFAKTFDSGLTWEISLMPDYPVQHDAHFFNTQEGWAVGDVGHLIHTVDGGKTWQPYAFGEKLKVKSLAFANKHVGWAVGEKGLVLHTTHGGFDWKRENCGYFGNMKCLAIADLNTAFANGDQLDILTYQPGVLPNCGISAEDSIAGANPKRLLLSPNPAADYLEVKVSVQNPLQEGDKILIFNALGQLVLSLESKGESTAVDISLLPTGCYAIVVVREKTLLANGRFVKARG